MGDASWNRLEGFVSGVSKVPDTTTSAPVTDLECAQMEQLGRTLEEVLKQLSLARDGLLEANTLKGGDSFTVETVAINEASVQVQKQLEDVRKRAADQSVSGEERKRAAEDEATLAKRRRNNE